MLFKTLQALVAISICMLVFAFAFWKGERTERTISLAMVFAYLASGAFSERNDLIGPSWGVMVVDIALFAVIATLSVTTRRTWTAAAAGFQLINILLHVAVLIDLRISVYTYRMGMAIWSFMAIGALLVGTLQVIARQRRQALIAGSPG